ncbi:MAG: hypothetical protein HKN82_04500 [Akkermansiaceae bacterium]|nr:hypothetical protein [Akkermansiaceae bacterium]
MNGRNPFRAPALLAAGAIALILTGPSARASLVFSDDFESPDVTAAQSDGNTNGTIPSGWVGASSGFGSNRRGVVDESHGDFTDPAGEQAFAFRYTNSGLTTAAGVIGAAVAGATITVSFDVVMDGHNNGLPYQAGLFAFADGAPRNRVEFFSKDTLAELNSVSGSATGDGLYTNISFAYTIDGTADAAILGEDLAVRFKGATNSATIDNVAVDVEFAAAVPEASEALVVLLGLTGLLAGRRRPRRA